MRLLAIFFCGFILAQGAAFLAADDNHPAQFNIFEAAYRAFADAPESRP